LIEHAKHRDEQAFLVLIQRYMYVIQAVIRKYIRSIINYEEEDIIKMVVLHAWEKISELRGGEEAFKCWLGRKTNWICLDLLRKQKQEGNIIPMETLNDHAQDYPQNSGPTTLEILLTEEQESLFQEAMNSLPEVYKQTISLRYRGLSYAQIAEILEIDSKTVGSRLNRGINMIKNSLEKRGVLD
jgi:RNA polymerase sigma-70 factor (ECF subfamily)